MSHGVWTERFQPICNTDPITRRYIFQSDFWGYVGMFHTHYPAKFRTSLYTLHTDMITTVNVHGRVFNLHTFPPKWTYSSSIGLGIRMTRLTCTDVTIWVREQSKYQHGSHNKLDHSNQSITAFCKSDWLVSNLSIVFLDNWPKITALEINCLVHMH